MEANDSPVGADVLVARAMDQALAGERAAQAAIAECEQQAANVLERARQQRRAVLERAQARIIALHTRAAADLERQATATAEKGLLAAATAVEQLSDSARYTRSLERLAARLTTDDTERAQDAR